MTSFMEFKRTMCSSFLPSFYERLKTPLSSVGCLEGQGTRGIEMECQRGRLESEVMTALV